MRPPRSWRNDAKLGRADDVDPAVLTVFKAEYFDARDDAVPDDPVEIATDQLGRSLRAHPGGYPQLSIGRPAGDPPLQGFDVAAGKCDLCQMELRHLSKIAPALREIKNLAVQTKQLRQPEEKEEAKRVGHRGDEHGGRDGGVDPQLFESDRDQNT